ncbi:MAG: hypothetical protein C4527_13830 [Candidatus Omnitrophota bacterium]|jgi:hypothetical protein|nr:MAG: hypothetical protein C4527_13830 [Candidatus Omnitrophota bacterium]
MKKIYALGFMICIAGFATVTMAQVVPLDHADAGVTVLIPDTILFGADVDMGKYWEPFTDVFGDGTLAFVAGAYPQGQTSGMNMKVAFFNVDGSIEEYWGFYGDAGSPFIGGLNEARKDGNPPRIATDRRPGGTRYAVGIESTPYLYSEFESDGRWDKQFVYTANQIAAVQLFNKTPNGPVPITKVIDPVYGQGNIAGVQNNQMRFGGDMRFLSDGNLIVVVEDRNKGVVPGGNAAVGTLFNGETGAVIKGPFNAAGDDQPHEIWSNMAPFDGGFAVRTQGIMTLYNNAAEVQHVVVQSDWTTVKDTGRGDGTRICSTITSDFVYILGNDDIGDMVLSRINAKTAQADTQIVVNEEELWFNGTFGRGDCAIDEKGNICVAYVFNDGVQDQVVARIFGSNLEPAGPTFYAFTVHDRYDAASIMGYVSKEVNVSMNNQRIIIGANGVTLDPNKNAITAAEQAFAVVLENPYKEETSISTWDLY